MLQVLEQDLVTQEARSLGQGILNRMRACIVGGNAELRRFYVESERDLTNAGPYVPESTAVRIAYPSARDGALVDLDSVRVYLSDIKMEDSPHHESDHPDMDFTAECEVGANAVVVPGGLTVSPWEAHGDAAAAVITAATVHIEYRAWCSDMADSVRTAKGMAVDTEIPGPEHPDNPLKYGVRMARENSGRTAVDFIAVSDPNDLDAWKLALKRMSRGSMYSVVPLTRDPAVLALVAEFVERRSKAESSRECVMWVSPTTEEADGTDAAVDAIADVALAYNNKRVRAVWPDTAISNGYTIQGWHICAALAGLRSGCAPHQTLTGIELHGIDVVPRTLDLLTDEQLDTLAESGIWVVTEDQEMIVTRQALTTGAYGNPLNHDEMVVTNLDSVSKRLRNTLTRVIGRQQSSRNMRNQVHCLLQGQLNALASHRINRIGRQLVDSELRTVRPHVFMRERIVVSMRLVVPVAAGLGLSASTIEVDQQITA